MTDPTGATETASPDPTIPAQSTAPPTTPTGSPSSTESDWTDQVTDLIVDTVDKVRARTTGPILEISRISVHAVVALILLLPVAVLAIVGLIRLVTYWVGEVWITYTILGTLFLLIGVVLWSRRRPSTS